MATLTDLKKSALKYCQSANQRMKGDKLNKMLKLRGIRSLQVTLTTTKKIKIYNSSTSSTLSHRLAAVQRKPLLEEMPTGVEGKAVGKSGIDSQKRL